MLSAAMLLMEFNPAVAFDLGLAAGRSSSLRRTGVGRRLERTVAVAPRTRSVVLSAVKAGKKKTVTTGSEPMLASTSESKASTSESMEEGCDIARPLDCAGVIPKWLLKLSKLQDRGLGSVMLLLSTTVSLLLANSRRTSAAWLSFWSTPLGMRVGGHAMSPQQWINEGLMAIFFFVVGLEIKLELRHGSLSSVKKALLPCIAAIGGMVMPMLVYLATTMLMGGGSLAALTVPMATDIAFAMAIFGFFRARMPPSSSAFLMTLATVDDLGAIVVLATCFAHHISPIFLGAAAALTAGLGMIGRRQVTNARVFAAGGAALWWCLLKAGVSADIAGVLTALCISTRAMVEQDGEPELLTERLVTRLSPLNTFFIMPLFALANTAVPLGGVLKTTAACSAPNSIACLTAKRATLTPAASIATGLLVGKPLGIFLATKLATRLDIAQLPAGMNNKHLGAVSLLGAIGFTMCLLLEEVAMPPAVQAVPKLAVLLSSAVASIAGAAWMWRLRPWADEVVDAFDGLTSTKVAKQT